MGYKIAEVSKELEISKTAINKRVKEENFKEYIYEENGDIYIKEEGIRKLLEDIEVKKIYDYDKDKEIELLNMEVSQLKRELNIKEKENFEKDKYIIELESKLQEMKILEERYSNVEEKIVTNMRGNLIKRTERNKKKKWFLK